MGRGGVVGWVCDARGWLVGLGGCMGWAAARAGRLHELGWTAEQVETARLDVSGLVGCAG